MPPNPHPLRGDSTSNDGPSESPPVQALKVSSTPEADPRAQLESPTSRRPDQDPPSRSLLGTRRRTGHESSVRSVSPLPSLLHVWVFSGPGPVFSRTETTHATVSSDPPRHGVKGVGITLLSLYPGRVSPPPPTTLSHLLSYEQCPTRPYLNLGSWDRGTG